MENPFVENPFTVIEKRFNSLETLLQQLLTEKHESHKTLRPLVPRIKAAKLLDISLPKLDALTKNGSIECVPVGRHVKYTEQAIEDYIESLKEVQ